MSNLVFSNIHPAQITDKNLNQVLLDLIEQSSKIIVASGYISNDAIVEIHRIVADDLDRIKELSIFIGMHYIEGFTKNQYCSCVKLNQLLLEKGVGAVYVSPNMSFHGKMYSFVSNEGEHTGLIGSANLSSFIKSIERTYETMFLAKNDETAKDIYDKNLQLFAALGVRIDEAEPLREEDFIQSKLDLSNLKGVTKIDELETSKLLDQKSEYCFEIEIKPEEKSHLNPFFGKGRENSRGFIVPRPWYEAEIIVSKSITSLEGYPPKGEIFKVVTEDGWSFECVTQGTNSKNLRSVGSLSILGKWLKGNLELKGCLQTGEKVTEKVFEDYGTNQLILRSTAQHDVWIMEF